MKKTIRFRGKLRSYLYGPLTLTIVLAVLNIPAYMCDVRSGALFTGFTVLYFAIEVFTYYYTKPRLVNEIINFATQYATVQKRLLNEFEIAYALVDYNGKLLWVNNQFTELTGKNVARPE